MELKFFFFLFAMLVFLYDDISCDVINVKNLRDILKPSVKFWGTFLKFWLRPCIFRPAFLHISLIWVNIGIKNQFIIYFDIE